MTEQELEYIRTWFTVWLLKYGDVPLPNDVFFDLKWKVNSTIGNKVSTRDATENQYLRQWTDKTTFTTMYQINKRP